MRKASLRSLLIVFCVSLVMTTGSGCAVWQKLTNPNYEVGAEPFVVQQERAHQNALDICDTFLQFDDANVEFIRAKMPEIHVLAEKIRANRTLFESYFEAIQTYKATRDSVDKDSVKAISFEVATLARQARAALANAKTVKAKT